MIAAFSAMWLVAGIGIWFTVAFVLGTAVAQTIDDRRDR